MPGYTYYDKDTGEITGYYRGSKEPSLNGSDYVSGIFDRKQYIIFDGIAVRKSDEELESELIGKKWIDLRLIRNALLSESDWTQVPDAPLTETQKSEWRIYRQKLRDLPANTEDPRNVIWPTEPSG